MFVPKFGITFIGAKVLFRPFLALALLPVLVLLILFLPIVWSVIGLVLWFVFVMLSYRSAWSYCNHVLDSLSVQD